MSTVLLTPTHIGSDHMVVTETIPVTMKVDVNHPKIFASDDKTFIYALVGEYDPDWMITEKIQSLLQKICEQIYKLTFTDKNPKTILAIRDKDIIRDYRALLGKSFQISLVTKKTRHLVYNTGDRELKCQELGDYSGMGSGGVIAKGLVLGGMDIHDIWKIVNEMVPNSSAANTVIPLSLLRDFPFKKESDDAQTV